DNKDGCADPKVLDGGLVSLVMLARFHQVAADPEQISHHFARQGESLNSDDIVLAARHLKLKAKAVSLSLAQLQKVTLPAIAKSKGGQYFILAKTTEES